MIIKIEGLNESILSKLKEKIFIYPTDTIYGIGCDAENIRLVGKIRKIKGRDNKPFSIIAPNFGWILENCETSIEELKKYLPGPYTLILKKRKSNFLKHISENEFIGIRIPDHHLMAMLQKMDKPIVTTSVNLSGKDPANKIQEIDKKVLRQVDLIIDAGELSGKPSKLVKEGKIIER